MIHREDCASNKDADLECSCGKDKLEAENVKLREILYKIFVEIECYPNPDNYKLVLDYETKQAGPREP